MSGSELVTLSASKLKTYNACPRKYWYEYVQHKSKMKHPAAVLGIAVHKTIERLHKEGDIPSGRIIVLADEYQKESLASEVQMDARLFSDGVKMVDTYDIYKRTPIDTEKEFTLEFPNKAHALCKIKGYLDQVYNEGFIDLKTNKAKPMRGVLDNDLQFIIYTWAFKEIYGYEPELRLWNHLRTGEELEASTLNKVDQAQRIIERVLESEFTGIYDTCVGDACRICSYRLSCLGRED